MHCIQTALKRVGSQFSQKEISKGKQLSSAKSGLKSL